MTASSRTATTLTVILLIPLVVALGSSSGSTLMVATAITGSSNQKEEEEGFHHQPRLKKVIFVHRHCARTPMVDTDFACKEIGCGMCTEQGELMLKATGESFRERYGSILPDKYLPKRGFVSLSDSVIRCIQSSAAFLRGLFAFNSTYEVFTATETTGADVIDPWNGQPTYPLHYMTNVPGIQEVLRQNITKYFSSETIISLAEEVNYNITSCKFSLVDCMASVSDFIFYARAQGILTENRFPLARKNLPALVEYRNFATRLQNFAYDTEVLKDGFFDRAGWPAHLLLDQILLDAEAEGNQEDGEKKKGATVSSFSSGEGESSTDQVRVVYLHEYSGHDSTLMPLYSAMGNYSWTYPEFATSLVFEVYDDADAATPTSNNDRVSSRKSSDDDYNPLVVVKMAVPSQLPTGNHTIQWFDYNVTCMRKGPLSSSSKSSSEVVLEDEGEMMMYYSVEGCPLSDLKRFASTRRGDSKRQKIGECYADHSDLVAQNCTDTTGVKPTNSVCIFYRKACPLNGCGEGAYMKEDYSCMKV